jgi:1,4-alpha-glucan branching enzyme
MAKHAPDADAIAALLHARHGDPFAVLGPHQVSGGCAIRAVLPNAVSVVVIDHQGHPLAALEQVHPDGFWSGTIPHCMPYRLRIDWGHAIQEIDDPYALPPILGELDLHLLAEGKHHDFGRCLGAHAVEFVGHHGVRFAVWAPNARRVSVIGEFNHWDGRRHPMRLRHEAGIWELFIPQILPGALYKYELVGAHGELLVKADPVAWATERPPATASVVASAVLHTWDDQDWLERRAARQSECAAIAIYEVHAFSWLPAFAHGNDGWSRLAERLVPYAARMGFTHIELLPVMEHPFGGSWGYQPLGQFAPSARLGSPGSFARFVEECHHAGLGVILDWVPAHFPTDAYGLARFDGTALYEHEDPREGFHRDWNTLIYNLGRNEVRGFLIGSALHWLEHYHVDGLRVDAVASMLYRDYSRAPGEWIPNRYGGRENLEAIDFLQELSRTIRTRCPGAVLIAEESTAWPGVTRSPEEGGLGFQFKWNMGWMHDTLHYMQEDPVHRCWHHGEITFGLIYAWSERFILPLSHDEVVYGKRSLIGRMPGDRWQRFANLRAYFGFMWTHPGKKLLFMGGEFAQEHEWDHDAGLQWHQLDDPMRSGMQALVRDLNRTYRQEPALHALDCAPEGFRWIVIDDSEQSVFAYLRFGAVEDAPVLVICNFTPVPRYGYRLGVPRGGGWQEILNTDSATYGGSNLGNAGYCQAENAPLHNLPASLRLDLPPLGTLILRAI